MLYKNFCFRGANVITYNNKIMYIASHRNYH